MPAPNLENQNRARIAARLRPGRNAMRLLSLPIFVICLLGSVDAPAPADATIDDPWTPVPGSSSMMVGAPRVDIHGVKYYPVKSAYQGFQRQFVRVLEPINPAPGKPRRLVYVLPVEAGVNNLKSTWSDGLEELRLLEVSNRFNMTFIAPSFPYEPWYGDDVTNPTHRMESFIVDDLVPFGERFAQGNIPQRYLLGFSKSGNGAFTLLLRNPRIFNGATVWDFPAQLSSFTKFPALRFNFGTEDNFKRYNIPALVLNNSEPFKQQNRLWISGDQSDFWRKQGGGRTRWALGTSGQSIGGHIVRMDVRACGHVRDSESGGSDDRAEGFGTTGSGRAGHNPTRRRRV